MDLKKGGERGGRTEEGENQPNVSPPVAVVHIQLGVVFIPNRDRTVPTKRGIRRVIQVPAKVLYELARPTDTRFGRGRVEDGELLRVTSDFETTVKRREVVRSNSEWEEGKKKTYCSSVVSIEPVILTQGFNWYNHDRNQP